MTKTHRANKEAKKQPAHTLKEKRSARKSKKDARNAPQPIVTRQ